MLPIPVIIITISAIVCAFVGVWLESAHDHARKLVPFGGGALLGVALFWVLPEMASTMQWPAAVLWIGSGVLALALINRYVYSVCPSCSPAHDHEHCSTSLHGFALPLLLATALHAALDGWSASAAQDDAILGLGFVTGIAAHKIPEGLALGMIARAALPNRTHALLWCALAESATLLGAAAENALAPYVGANGLHVLLAIAGGSFLYLGYHAVHSEFRRSGASPALVPALTGVAGSSFLRLLLR